MLNFSFFKLTRVGGWINSTNIKLLYITAKFFVKKINILEIGTHYGRSLIPLVKGSKKINKVVVLDIFEKQKLNLSNSGSGDRRILLKNIKNFNINLSDIFILNDKSSNYKKYNNILNEIGKFDIIHIDGGHLKSEVKNDINISYNYSNFNSVLILDDIFNPAYPEVIQGFLESKRKYYPIFLTDQKLFFTKNNKLAKKLQKFVFLNKDLKKKEINFFNKKTYFIFEEDKYFNYFVNKFNNIKSLFYFKYHF